MKTLRGAFLSDSGSSLTLVVFFSWLLLVDACSRDLASENGYVIVDAIALLIAANRNVACGEGSDLLFRGRRLRFRASKKKNVREGFNVRMRDAE